MHKFSLPLSSNLNMSSGEVRVGIAFPRRGGLQDFYDGTTPGQEDRGISQVDAEQLVKLNKLITEATEAALNAGCLVIQEALGVTSGDVAGIHFSGKRETAWIAHALANYLISEHNMADGS